MYIYTVASDNVGQQLVGNDGTFQSIILYCSSYFCSVKTVQIFQIWLKSEIMFMLLLFGSEICHFFFSLQQWEVVNLQEKKGKYETKVLILQNK